MAVGTFAIKSATPLQGPGMDEAVRMVDRGTIGERLDGTDAGNGHEASAYRIITDRIGQHLVEGG